jgi:hypothetical protein
LDWLSVRKHGKDTLLFELSNYSEFMLGNDRPSCGRASRENIAQSGATEQHHHREQVMTSDIRLLVCR